MWILSAYDHLASCHQHAISFRFPTKFFYLLHCHIGLSCDNNAKGGSLVMMVMEVVCRRVRKNITIFLLYMTNKHFYNFLSERNYIFSQVVFHIYKIPTRLKRLNAYCARPAWIAHQDNQKRKGWGGKITIPISLVLLISPRNSGVR